MACFSKSFYGVLFLLLLLLAGGHCLSPTFYEPTCPRLKHMVRNTVKEAVQKNPMVAAGLLRLFFHDCFVNGCDASVLLDDTATMVGEKNAAPNMNSLRGFEVIDDAKALVEASCPAIVSCADILAIAARYSVSILNGPKWKILLGRRDARTASGDAAVANLPSFTASVSSLIATFTGKGFSAQDLVALSGAHTLGESRCSIFRGYIYSNASSIQPEFATALKSTCPPVGNDSILAPLDVETPADFDNKFYQNLLTGRGLLPSDQALFSGDGGAVDDLVRNYSTDSANFFRDFAAAMMKMQSLSPPDGDSGEIRLNCRKMN